MNEVLNNSQVLITHPTNIKENKKNRKIVKKHISADIVNKFQFMLKKLSVDGNFKTVDDKNIICQREQIKEIISCYKKNDVDWYLSNSIFMLSSKQFLKKQNLDNFIFTTKLINLLIVNNSISRSTISPETYELLKELILYNAYRYSEPFYKKISNTFIDIKISELESDFLNEFDNSDTKMNWVLTQRLFEVCINETLSDEDSEMKKISMKNVSVKIANYFSFREEAQAYLKQKPSKRKKHTRKNFMNMESYSVVSNEMSYLLDEIRNCIHFLDGWEQEEFISFISELQIKSYLPDLPPMTFLGWIDLFFRYAILILWAIIILYPVFILIQQGFNANNTSVVLDMQHVKFSTDSYSRLFKQTDYSLWLTNSTIIAFFSMIITVFLIALTAYAFSRFRYRGKRAFLITLLVTQMVPAFTSIIVLYIIIQLFNAAFSVPPIVTLLFIYVGGGVASNTVILKGYMDSISTDIDDAARIDGCSHFWIFIRIIFPLCKPMLVLIALMSFIGPFGDVILPRLILTDPNNYTVAIGLNNFINGTMKNYASYFAGATLVSVPIAILFLLLQRFVVAGMTVGGVKG